MEPLGDPGDLKEPRTWFGLWFPVGAILKMTIVNLS